MMSETYCHICGKPSRITGFKSKTIEGCTCKQRIAELEAENARLIRYNVHLIEEAANTVTENKAPREQVATMPVLVGYVSEDESFRIRNDDYGRRWISKTPTIENKDIIPVYLDPLPQEPTKTTSNFLNDFWKLRISERREIMTDLGLIDVGDMHMPENKRYESALLKAKERGVLDEVIAKVASYTPQEKGE